MVFMVLRKNRVTGVTERLQPDGTWLAVDNNVGTESVAPADSGNVDWQALGDLFKSDESEGDKDSDAAGPVAADSDPGTALAVAVSDGGAVAGEVVSEDALVDEIPGLTSSDGARGTGGARGVLQTLRTRAARNRRGKKDSGADGASTVVVGRIIEVSATNAQPRGPAVKDSTQARIDRRLKAKPETAAQLVRYVPKPAPDILSDQPKWVRELFEAHFRGSRTLELRRMPIGINGKNRMKLSRADYAIGWLVLLEAARKDPAILHLRELKNGNNSDE